MRDFEIIALKSTTQGHVWQHKKWLDDKFFVQIIPRVFFIKNYHVGFLKTNQHFLIQDGHGSHIILEAIK
jgi:hypothetical protein